MACECVSERCDGCGCGGTVAVWITEMHNDDETSAGVEETRMTTTRGRDAEGTVV